MKNKFKKIIFSLLLILLLIFLVSMLFNISKAYVNKTNFENSILKISEKNENTIFAINEITLFSSCDAETDIKNNTNLTLKNLYQYTDIAIFINNKLSSNNLSAENTLKEVYIDNIKFSNEPKIGTPSLYYKSLNYFSKSNFEEENKLDTKLEFSVTSEDLIDYESPTLYNNCANPITLGYINNNIKTNYSINTSGSIKYDGSLLKKSNIILSSIACTINFDIYITNNLNQKFKCPVSIDIPLESDSKSIYDGSILTKNTNKFVFYRYE